jgi:prepilin-type N-terminal cleavage/methylation domain-containing protein
MSVHGLRNQHGFTLSELLVACALIGVVMAGLFSILQSGQQSYLTGSNQVEAQQALRLGFLRMTNELRDAGYCPTCGGGAAPFSALASISATGFTIQNDWNGDGVVSTGTVTQTVTGMDGTTGTVTRGEQIVYAVAGNSLARREMGIDAAGVDVVTNLASLTFTYLDADGNATATPADVRTIVISAVGQPEVQAASFGGGRVQVPMTDSVRLRNRAK